MRARPTHDLFAWLIDPIDRTTFFRDIFARQAVVTARGDPERLRAVLTLNDIEAWLRQPGFLDTQSASVRHGDPVQSQPVRQVEDAYAGLARGWTLQIADPQSRFAPDSLAVRIARALETELGQATTLGAVFLTPAGSQALARHHDKMDIFTMQIAGSKTWELYERLPPERVREDSGDEPMRLDRVVRVGPGETFYIPRGVPHRVVGDEPDERAASLYGGASLSLAYGYMPPTWTTLRHVLAERVSSDPVLAEQMPPRVWESADDAMIAGYLERLRRVAAEMTVADVRASLEGYRLGQPAHEAEPHLAEVLATGEMADDDLVVPRRGLAPRVENSARGCRLAFAGDRAVNGPAAIRPALDYVAQRSAPFAVRDLPGRLSDASKRKLAKRLVTEGFLRRHFQI